MSHQFDTPTAREDPRINLCDFYLFAGARDSTVLAMTVNPDAGLSSPDTFRDDGIYAFRFDLNGDAREEAALRVAEGDVVASGRTGEIVEADDDVKIFAGLAPDLFAGDRTALKVFRNAIVHFANTVPVG
jgi:hypothetical protein